MDTGDVQWSYAETGGGGGRLPYLLIIHLLSRGLQVREGYILVEMSLVVHPVDMPYMFPYKNKVRYLRAQAGIVGRQ